MSKTPQPVKLTGLSLEDRELMLTMMAALGQAAQTMMKCSQQFIVVAHAVEEDMSDGWMAASEAVDAEANSLIDICKKAKDRLKPGSAVILN